MTELPARTHNNPPAMNDVEWLSEKLALDHIALIRTAEEQAALAKNIPDAFHADNEASFTADYIKRAQETQKQIESIRKEEKEPFLRQGQFVDTFFGELKEKLQAAIIKANKPLTDYLQRKAAEERRQREAEAAALRKEQEQAIVAVKTAEDTGQAIEHAVTMETVAKIAEQEAAAPLPTLAKATGKYSIAGLKPKWSAVIKDIEKLDLHKLRPYISNSELQKALERFVKQGGRQCDGAEIKEFMMAGVK